MSKTVRAAVVSALLLPFASLATHAQPLAPHAAPGSTALPSVATKTATMRHIAGLLPLDWDAKAGHLYLELPMSNGRSADLLYTESLPYGTGSNDLGLDRGQTAPGLIVHFERVGPKVLLVEPNQAFRSSSADAAEQLSVAQSFPSSCPVRLHGRG